MPDNRVTILDVDGSKEGESVNVSLECGSISELNRL